MVGTCLFISQFPQSLCGFITCRVSLVGFQVLSLQGLCLLTHDAPVEDQPAAVDDGLKAREDGVLEADKLHQGNECIAATRVAAELAAQQEADRAKAEQLSDALFEQWRVQDSEQRTATNTLQISSIAAGTSQILLRIVGALVAVFLQLLLLFVCVCVCVCVMVAVVVAV
jgi:hypothetical protein